VPDKQPAGIELDGELPPDLMLSPRCEPLEQNKPAAPATAAPLAQLRQASAHWLAAFLEHEHPQTVAVVVSHLPSDRAAELLARLSEDLQLDVARRLIDLDETDPEILREIELGLESRLREQAHGEQRRTAGLTALGHILDAANPRTKQHILTNLARQDRRLAGTLSAPQPAPLTFAEFEHLDPASLTVVLHHAQPELLVLAMAGASSGFGERVFDLFPPHESRRLRDSLAHLGPTRLSDVEDAQRELVELARELELRGEIAPDVRGRLSVAV
jgi:flagellar motor switch protein FliG